MDEANRFLSKEYIREFNKRFTVESQLEGTAFVPCLRSDLDRIFAIQTERVVNRDNTVKFKNLILQIDRQTWRGSLAGCRVMVCQHFDETISLGFGAHPLGRYSADGQPLKSKMKKISEAKAELNSTLLSKPLTGHLMC